MTKYYKLFKAYYKDLGNDKAEVVRAYKHHFGIERNLSSIFSLDEAEEITELQYNRVKKIVLAKLLNQ